MTELFLKSQFFVCWKSPFLHGTLWECDPWRFVYLSAWFLDAIILSYFEYRSCIWLTHVSLTSSWLTKDCWRPEGKGVTAKITLAKASACALSNGFFSWSQQRNDWFCLHSYSCWEAKEPVMVGPHLFWKVALWNALLFVTLGYMT